MFDKAVKRNKGDLRVRHLNCWTQFSTMLYAQLGGHRSLLDLETGFNSKANHHYHLGLKSIRRSTLADANSKRPLAIYFEFFYSLLKNVRHSTANEATKIIRLIDSTTIDLNTHDFNWAEFRTHKAGVKLHIIYDPDVDVPTFLQ